jgi:hypothetical protein
MMKMMKTSLIYTLLLGSLSLCNSASHSVIFGSSTANRRQLKLSFLFTAALMSQTHAQSALNCDFESGGCFFSNYDSVNAWGWKTNSGQTPTALTGPSADHTTNTTQGTYIYTEVQGCLRGTFNLNLDIAAATGGTFYDVGISFWYNMYGSRMGSLAVQT